MKRYIYCALMALLCLACSKEDDPLMDTPIIIPKTLYAQAPVFESRALVEEQPISWDDSETVDSRTYAEINQADTTEYFQYWSSGDAISLFLTTANLQYQLQSYKDSEDVGIFDLVGNETQGTALTTNYYYAVYPYKSSTSINYESGEITYNFPKTQHYAGDSYANGENGMIAREPKETDDKYYFQNFCSYLQLRLVADSKNESNKVKQITLAANNANDKMAGEASIIYDLGDTIVVNMKMTASNQLILDCGDGVELSNNTKNPTKFWFVLPGGFTFSEGFKITVTFDNEKYFEKSTSKEITIKRSHIRPMVAFTPTIEEEDDIILTDPIRYKYKDTSITEPYPLNNTFYGENGEQLQIIDQVYDEETGEWEVLLSGTLKTIGGNSFQEFDPELEYITIDNEDKCPIVVSDFAFYNCTADSIKIYNEVESINESSFENAATTYLYIDDDVSTLKANLGSGSYLEEIVINGSVTTIEDFAFLSCMDLQSISFNSVETIGYRAFYQCRGLSDIDLSTVKYISDGAFRGCTSLPEVVLDSVITIGDNAFMGCTKLTSAVISENCTMIGEGAFCNNSRLQTVTCYAVLPPFIKTDNTDGSYVFDRAHKNLKVYIPNGSMGDYTDPKYFVKNNSGYTSPVQSTINWWYQEYTGKLQVMEN